VCAPLLRCNRRRNRLHAHFEQDRGRHLELFPPTEESLPPLLHMAQSALLRVIC
jgi:hypothetical protein